MPSLFVKCGADYASSLCAVQGKKARGTVTDRCAGCPGPNDVDMTKTLFKQLADESVGRIKGLQWHFV